MSQITIKPQTPLYHPMGKCWNWGFWVGELPSFSVSSFHPNTLNWLYFVQFCQLITPQVITVKSHWSFGPPRPHYSRPHLSSLFTNCKSRLYEKLQTLPRPPEFDVILIKKKNEYCCLTPLSCTGYPEGDVFLIPSAAQRAVLRLKGNTGIKKHQ